MQGTFRSHNFPKKHLFPTSFHGFLLHLNITVFTSGHTTFRHYLDRWQKECLKVKCILRNKSVLWSFISEVKEFAKSFNAWSVVVFSRKFNLQSDKTQSFLDPTFINYICNSPNVNIHRTTLGSNKTLGCLNIMISKIVSYQLTTFSQIS